MEKNKYYDLCCIGHVTKDKIVTKSNVVFAAGGTAYYFSYAIKNFDDVDYYLNTIVGETEEKEVHNFRNAGIEVSAVLCRQSVYFENIYGENTDERRQRVLSKADPFSLEMLNSTNARIIHLGPLLNDDFSTGVINAIAHTRIVSLDVQGFLRTVNDAGDVIPVDWKDKEEILKKIHFLKANEYELATLTGTPSILDGINRIKCWGVKEIIVTLGSSGSIIFDGKDYHKIPAYKPQNIIDATGCGDTYMAGYLYSRIKNKTIQEAGNFAAAMATLKIEHTGPFSGTKTEINKCLNAFEKYFPDIDF